MAKLDSSFKLILLRLFFSSSRFSYPFKNLVFTGQSSIIVSCMIAYSDQFSFSISLSDVVLGF